MKDGFNIMVTKFNNKKNKKILCCVIDNLGLYQSGWAREISINLSDFMLHRLVMHHYDVYIGKEEDELIYAAYSENFYSHVVVIACGTSFKLSDRIFTSIENLCKREFSIAGHILDRGESYYELHHQFYVINLQEYSNLNFPKIGKEEDIEHYQISPIRSDECLNGDNQIPIQISSGNKLKLYSKKLHGWNILSTAFSQNKILIDVGNDIRDNKKYVYFEHDHVFLREVSNIYYNQFFCNNFFAATNSDSMHSEIPFNGPVEQYITVGIGFNWINNLNLIGFTKDTTVVFTDINHNCLKFMQAMLTDWDGIDYGKFYKDHLTIYPNNIYIDIDSYSSSANTQWTSFINSFDNWPDLWKRIKELHYEFINIDYMSSYNIDWIEPNKKTFINLSDVFTHAPYVATQSLKYRVACENRLINALNQKDPNIVLKLGSRSADGFHPNEERIRLDKVSNFDLTDINELKKPDWHLNDWISPKLLS
jgi:hypothetical protein